MEQQKLTHLRRVVFNPITSYVELWPDTTFYLKRLFVALKRNVDGVEQLLAVHSALIHIDPALHAELDRQLAHLADDMGIPYQAATPPIRVLPPQFSIGDSVCFTDDNGIPWHSRRICHIQPSVFGHRYGVTPTDTPGFTIPERNLRLESLDRDTSTARPPQDGSLRRTVMENPRNLDGSPMHLQSVITSAMAATNAVSF